MIYIKAQRARPARFQRSVCQSLYNARPARRYVLELQILKIQSVVQPHVRWHASVPVQHITVYERAQKASVVFTLTLQYRLTVSPAQYSMHFTHCSPALIIPYVLLRCCVCLPAHCTSLVSNSRVTRETRMLHQHMHFTVSGSPTSLCTGYPAYTLSLLSQHLTTASLYLSCHVVLVWSASIQQHYHWVFESQEHSSNTDREMAGTESSRDWHLDL